MHGPMNAKLFPCIRLAIQAQYYLGHYFKIVVASNENLKIFHLYKITVMKS